MNIAEVEENAIRLTAAEREVLAKKLFDSVHNQELTEVDLAWLDIAETRLQKLRSGEDDGLNEAEFFSKVQNDLGWK
jgi:hypothetical protein